MTSLASPIHQRYTAGSCTLDVTLQLSALSQWQPQPVAHQLQFQLWLRPADSDETAATLVTEGDRQTLQSVTHYIQQQTRATLALASLNTGTARSVPPLPPGCKIASPLSYLQLCDLTTVLNQCEQAVRPLPVSLSLALASEPSSSATESSPERNSRNSGNLISLAAVRRRPKLWASSAAAAVFAIGLTTTLWPVVNRDATTSAPEVASESDYSAAAPRPDQSPSNQSPEASAPRDLEAPDAIAVPEGSNTLPALPGRSAGRSAGRSENPPAGSRAPDSRPKQPPSPLPNQPAQSANPESNEPLASAPANISEDAPAAARQAEPIAPSAASSAASADTAEEFSVADAPTPVSPAATDEADTIAQIQAYFAARWQPDQSASQAPLAYQMRLSGSGEVVTFAALSEAAQAYRDRLLPPDGQPLTFSVSPDSATSGHSTTQSAGMTLRIVLTASGQVQISKF
ncbi:hypothetical protein BH23CYA1_BH23CYA1_00350 [soil metagenome]